METVQPKTWCHSFKVFLYPYFPQLNFHSSVSHEALIILLWATRRTHPRGYLQIIILKNSSIYQHGLLTHVCLCVKLYVRIGAQNSFATFLPHSYNILWLRSHVYKTNLPCFMPSVSVSWHRGECTCRKKDKLLLEGSERMPQHRLLFYFWPINDQFFP